MFTNLTNYLWNFVQSDNAENIHVLVYDIYVYGKKLKMCITSATGVSESGKKTFCSFKNMLMSQKSK